MCLVGGGEEVALQVEEMHRRGLEGGTPGDSKEKVTGEGPRVHAQGAETTPERRFDWNF